MTHALVLGKFYPPHAGHHHLIDTALAQADRVTVLVAGAAHESIPLEARAAWLQERHPQARVVWGADDTRVDYDDPAVWDAHMAVFRRLCPERVDVVLTSEAYGPELARRFGGARHVAVDPARTRFPVSGTAVRADPAACWRHLSPAVRAGLAVRVAVVGAESTGGTTLSQDLAAHYDTAWVPEAGRDWTARRVAAGTPMDQIAWSDADFLAIAREQQALEDRLARGSGPVLVCDTDAVATCLWQERYRGRSTSDVEAVAAGRRYALYVLTGDDIPFVQDGLRDGEAIRGWMTRRFRARLACRPEPSIEVRGSREERLRAAVAAIEEAVARAWSFAEPV